MNRSVVVTYISRLDKLRPSDTLSPAALEFRAASQSGAWVLDVGDDPAFFSARKHAGPVTWGVCRQDVRNHLQPGDLVTFFAVKFNPLRDAAQYFLSAALTVQATVSQESVFRNPELEPFRRYLNLLIRPSATGWEHFEPALPQSSWHSDWLWRICVHHGLPKSAFLEAGPASSIGPTPTIRGVPLQFAHNYVVFSANPSSSVVFNPAPLVAHWRKPDQHEDWLETPAPRRIRSIVFAGSNRQHLRTSNRQQPHRHLWASDPSVRGQLPQALSEAVSGA
jgi:hypothetical protein